MTEFMGGGAGVDDMVGRLTDKLCAELMEAYPGVRFGGRVTPQGVMGKIGATTGTSFVVVIDEWDAPMRERRHDEAWQRAYLDFLRNWLKDREWLALAYMTGILPVKKYGAHSALNMFDEYSMTAPLKLAPFTGFTSGEVRAICAEHGLHYGAMRDWYDGYRLSNTPSPELLLDVSEGTGGATWEVYSPLSVVRAALTKRLGSYWTQTETYEALAEYIRMDFDGLRRAVALMMDGGRVPARLGTYQNDMTTFHSRDDVIALLVHLGYLGWDSTSGEAFIPNYEIREVFVDSTWEPAWEPAFQEYEASKALVRSTWAMDECAVASALDAARNEAPNRDYNSGSALSYAVRLAYYAAMRWYTTLVEFDSGRGFADVRYLPAPGKPDLPALVVELKWGSSPGAALAQIRNRDYPARLAHYAGNILLVGISYDRDAKPSDPTFKRHVCRIERA